MAYESAAGRTISIPERLGRPVPKVTDQEVMVVELYLNVRPKPEWLHLFNEKLGPNRPAEIGWLNVHTGEERPYIAIKLEDRNAMLAAVEKIDRVIEATSAEWKQQPEVAEAIVKQQRIDALQAYLERVAQTQ